MRAEKIQDCFDVVDSGAALCELSKCHGFLFDDQAQPLYNSLEHSVFRDLP
jgi:hypothetical protein